METADLLPSVEINPPSRIVNVSIIWLHGLGANGHDFAEAVPQLPLPPEHHIRFIFPHAPNRPVTLNQGYVMPAWYDILGLTEDTCEDEQGIMAAERQIQALIAHEESRGIPSHRIFLAGFSQGGALALHTGLRYPKKLAGILGLSTYMPLSKNFKEGKFENNSKTPIFIAHGSHDDLVPLKWGEYAKRLLKELKYPVDWFTYSMGHEICQAELSEIAKWISRH